VPIKTTINDIHLPNISSHIQEKQHVNSNSRIRFLLVNLVDQWTNKLSLIKEKKRGFLAINVKHFLFTKANYVTVCLFQTL
jgi:hypothetical protein